MKSTHSEHEGYGIYLVTWMALLALTTLTVTVAGMQLGRISILVAIVVAAIKATVVTFFFMHLREERTSLKVMVLVCLATLAIFIGITFFDVLFR